jgi:hypothetical protein
VPANTVHRNARARTGSANLIDDQLRQSLVTERRAAIDSVCQQNETGAKTRNNEPQQNQSSAIGIKRVEERLNKRQMMSDTARTMEARAERATRGGGASDGSAGAPRATATLHVPLATRCAIVSSSISSLASPCTNLSHATPSLSSRRCSNNNNNNNNNNNKNNNERTKRITVRQSTHRHRLLRPTTPI